MDELLLFKKAFDLAFDAHSEQLDKGGKPYILHPLEVSSKCQSIHQKILGILHDVVEDTSVTLDVLRDNNFPETILSDLNMLTRRDDETYHEYILRISLSENCRETKLADLECNMNLERLNFVKNSDLKRQAKYLFFSNVLNKNIYTDQEFKCSINLLYPKTNTVYCFDYNPSSIEFSVSLSKGVDEIGLVGSKLSHSSLRSKVSSYMFYFL